MKRLFAVLSLLVIGLLATNCKKDDNPSDYIEVPLRDIKEVYTENIESIEEYLKNNYIIENGESIAFDSITSTKYAGQSVLADDSRLQSVIMNNDDYLAVPYTNIYNNRTYYQYYKSADTIQYKIYYMVINQGEGKTASPIDSIFIKRRNYNIKNELSSSTFNGDFYSFPPTLAEYTSGKSPKRMYTGERQILKFIKTATNITTTPDGTITYDESSAGRIIAFIPSGLGQFNETFGKISAYTPWITDITLINSLERDHDLDGIPSKYEVEQIKPAEELTIHDYFDYDTNDNAVPNFLDMDDDGDGISTKDEISYKDENGKTKYYSYDAPELKSCGSDVPRYLNNTCFPDKVDGEWVWR